MRVLRNAFAATLKNPDFLKEAEKAALEIDLVTGEEAEDVIKTATNAPKDVIERVKSLLGR